MTQAASNAASRAHSAAKGALRGSRPIAMIARAGYAAKGVTYGLVGILAAKAAFSTGGSTGGSKSAISTLAGEGVFGQVLLWAIAIGLAAYALWNFIRCAINPEDDGDGGWKEVMKRVFHAVSGIIYASLAFWTFKFLFGMKSGSSGDGGTQGMVAKVLQWPAGHWVVGIAGLCILGYGIVLLWKAYQTKLSEKLDLSSMSEKARKATIGFGRFGMAARGVVIGMVGWFFLVAAWQHDSSEAGGLGSALKTLGGFGNVLLGVVAVGLVAYGGYELIVSRYRRIDVQ